MTTTRDDIRGWLEAGKAQGATHVIIVCDGFHNTDYPIYVMPGQRCREVARAYDGENMQRIMEVYSLKLDIEAQLREFRAFHYED